MRMQHPCATQERCCLDSGVVKRRSNRYVCITQLTRAYYTDITEEKAHFGFPARAPTRGLVASRRADGYSSRGPRRGLHQDEPEDTAGRAYASSLRAYVSSPRLGCALEDRRPVGAVLFGAAGRPFLTPAPADIPRIFGEGYATLLTGPSSGPWSL